MKKEQVWMDYALWLMTANWTTKQKKTPPSSLECPLN